MGLRHGQALHGSDMHEIAGIATVRDMVDVVASTVRKSSRRSELPSPVGRVDPDLHGSSAVACVAAVFGDTEICACTGPQYDSSRAHPTWDVLPAANEAERQGASSSVKQTDAGIAHELAGLSRPVEQHKVTTTFARLRRHEEAAGEAQLFVAANPGMAPCGCRSSTTARYRRDTGEGGHNVSTARAEIYHRPKDLELLVLPQAEARFFGKRDATSVAGNLLRWRETPAHPAGPPRSGRDEQDPS